MAGRPMRRQLKELVDGLGGPGKIIERVASGETILAIANEIGVSRDLLSSFMNEEEERAEALRVARVRSGAAMAEQSLAIADGNPAEHAPKTRLQIESRRWLASCYDPDNFAAKPTTQVNIAIGGLHIGALRQRPALELPDPQVIDTEPLMD